MMDCDTTGIEPDLGLVKVKKLVGGGTMSIVNQTVPRALRALGYNRAQIDDIINYIDVEKTILGAPHLKKEHEPVFACSMGDNAIHYLGHVKMMAAVQPFISGAISKTVNMPEEVTVEEVEQLHMDAWKMDLKAIAIYRDNCKVAQPLSMAKKDGEAKTESTQVATPMEAAQALVPTHGVRRQLPRVRNARTFKFTVAGVRGYFTVGEYEDGTPGELFVSIAKQGSTLRGVMDAFATAVSYGLQYGVPLKKFVRTFNNTSFAPAGITDDPDIRTASSLIDYIFRRLGKTYLSFDDRLEVGLASIDEVPEGQTSLLEAASQPTTVVEKAVEQAIETVAEAEAAIAEAVTTVAASTADLPTEAVAKENLSTAAEPAQPAASQDKAEETTAVRQDDSAPLCYNCGNQTQRSGSCYVCTACGSTTGCS